MQIVIILGIIICILVAMVLKLTSSAEFGLKLTGKGIELNLKSNSAHKKRENKKKNKDYLYKNNLIKK